MPIHGANHCSALEATSVMMASKGLRLRLSSISWSYRNDGVERAAVAGWHGSCASWGGDR